MLEALLQHLATHTSTAQRRWNAFQHATSQSGTYNDDPVWVQLEQRATIGGWRCGYVCQPDEYTIWTLFADGVTPTAAAQALLAQVGVPMDSPIETDMDRLCSAADAAYAAFDFGTSGVRARSGWDYTMPVPTAFACTVYVPDDQHPEQPSVALRFVAPIVAGTIVPADCYVARCS